MASSVGKERALQEVNTQNLHKDVIVTAHTCNPSVDEAKPRDPDSKVDG